MNLTIEEQAFVIPDAVFKTVGINCWTDEVPPRRFMIMVVRSYADDHHWDQTLGLRVAVEHHREELLALALEAAHRGEPGLLLN